MGLGARAADAPADKPAVQALYAARQVINIVKRPGVDELMSKRVDFLTGYQNAAYAATYQAFVEKVRAAEKPLGSTKLSEAVARYLFKLMAYKDEYEVARLHTDKRFTDKIAAQFEGDYKLVHHLAPPLLAKKNAKGELVKQQMGAWVRPAFGLLAKMKGLRGTALDVFGYTEERKMERALIGEYRASIEDAVSQEPGDRAPGAGHGHRAHPRGDSRLWSCEAPPLGGCTSEVGRADGAVAQCCLIWLFAREQQDQEDVT